MIDISIVDVNGKSYSVKSVLEKMDSERTSMKILRIYEVNRTSSTSFNKVRTLFEIDPEIGNRFPSSAFPQLFNAITSFVGRKYKIPILVMI